LSESTAPGRAADRADRAGAEPGIAAGAGLSDRAL